MKATARLLAGNGRKVVIEIDDIHCIARVSKHEGHSGIELYIGTQEEAELLLRVASRALVLLDPATPLRVAAAPADDLTLDSCDDCGWEREHHPVTRSDGTTLHCAKFVEAPKVTP